MLFYVFVSVTKLPKDVFSLTEAVSRNVVTKTLKTQKVQKEQLHGLLMLLPAGNLFKIHGGG